MKKLTLSILSLIFLLCAAVGLVGCKEQHTHSFTEQKVEQQYLASEATCTESAKFYYSCSCGEKGTESFVSGNALGHSFTNYVSDNNATCTQDGTKTAKCDRCKVVDTITDEGSKLPHTFDKQVTTEKYLASKANCTEAAKYYYSCACGEKGTETFTYGNAKNHDYGTPVYVWSSDYSTCTATRVCKNDGNHIETETATATVIVTRQKSCVLDELSTFTATFENSAFTIQTQENVKTADKLGHDLTHHAAKAATCTETGWNAYDTCTRCDYTTYAEISALGHDYATGWTIDIQPTCTETGEKSRHCTRCNSRSNITEIEKLGHSFTNYVSDNNATCTQDGTKTAICDRNGCNVKSTVTDDGSAKGHTYSEEWSQSETEHWHASTCGHTTESGRAKHAFDENKKCTVCDYVTTKPLGLELQSSVFDIDVDAKTAYLKVANAVEDYDFSDKFTVADGARFNICTDKQCKNIIVSKKSDIVAGDNVFYILVTNEGDTGIYTLTIRRRPIYTVTFDTNGGSTVKSQQVEEDDLATEPSDKATRDGYTFVSWIFDFSKPITKNITIVANWHIVTYSILYELNGGTNNDSNPTEYTVVSEIVLKSPSKLGYVFDGWYTSNLYKENEQVKVIEEGTFGNIKIFAKWNPATYYVKFNKNNDKAVGAMGNQLLTYDSVANLTVNKFVLTGYTFIGWTTEADGKGTFYTDKQEVVNLLSEQDAVLNVYAKWNVNQYTISFVSNGGSNVDSITQDYGSTVTAPSKPSWNEKSFVGWFTDSSLTNEYQFTTMPAENITLYAKWIEYSVSLSSDKTTEISINDVVTAPDTYNATAIDTDGNPVNVVVTVIGGTFEAGKTVTVRLVATGLNGIYATKTISNIKVYGTPTLTYDTEKDYFNLSDTLNAALWNANVTDTFGTALAVSVSVKEANYSAGDRVTIVISATDITGNEVKVEIANVKVYGAPVITRVTTKNDMKATDTVGNELFGVSAVDSFGESLTVTTVKQSGTISGGNTITIKSSATDSKGNTHYITYAIKVYGLPTISGATKTSFKVEDTITLDTLGIVAKDSFNNRLSDVTLTLTEGVQAAGQTLTYLVTATDHLGNVQTRTIDGIRIYGTPTISFDSEKTSMKVTDAVNANLLSAVAKDSRNGSLTVTITVESGTIAGGNIVKFRLSTVDALGNEYSVVTQDIKVYSSDNITLTYNAAATTRIKKTSKGEEFGASAVNGFGEACTISIQPAQGYTLAGGNTINLYIVATDALGNTTKSALISNIKVYDTPTLTYERDYPYIQNGDSPYALFSVKDSFGEEVLFDVTIVSGSLDVNETIIYKITATDRTGNNFEETRELVVLDADQSILELYFNGVKSGTQRVYKNSNFTLPCDVGYYTVWFFNDVAITDNNANSLAVWANDPGIYKVTMGTPIAIVYTVSYTLSGGTNNSANPSQYTIESGDITLHESTRIGYRFIGWTGTDLTEATMAVVIRSGSYGNRSYIANWAVISYPIIYNLEGGVCSEGNPDAYTIESEVVLNAPSRVGYTFTGWSNGGKIEKGTTGEVTFTACWKANHYTVTLDANGGGIEDESLTVIFDAPYSLPTPIRNGYDFVGWYDDSMLYSCGNWTKADDVTLTAQWSAKDGISYLVNHYKQNADDDFYTLSEIEKLTGKTDATITPNVKTYYGFAAPAVQTATINADGTTVVDYYYTRNAHNLIVNTNTGEVRTFTLKYESNVSGAAAITREGYTFGGYYKDVELSTQLVTMPNCDMSVYAWWKEEAKPSVFIYHGTDFITIKNYYGGAAEVVIPAYIGNVPVRKLSATFSSGSITKVNIPNTVTSIGEQVFYTCKALVSITIPDSVTSIGRSAFEGCSGLVSIELPSGVTSIGQSAFYGCTGLTSITLPGGVTSMGDYAFEGCSKLTNLIIEDGVTIIGDFAFNYCTSLTKVIIPDSVTSIGDSAFRHCEKLANVTIGNGVKIIKYAAFDLCTELSNLTLGNNVISIGEIAFSECRSLTSIELPATLTNIGVVAFQNCKELKTIYFNGTVNEWCVISGLQYIMSGTRTLYIGGKNVAGYVSIEEGVTTISKYAFAYCNDIIEVGLPASIVTVGNDAFSGCNKLNIVYYVGSEEQWDAITIGTGNDSLKGATVFYECGDSVTYHFETNCDEQIDDVTMPCLATLPKLKTRTGYTFAGWYNNPTFDGSSVTVPFRSKQDSVLYAKWELNVYTITYLLNGWTNSAKNVTSYTINDGKIVFADPSKENELFCGWYLDADFENYIKEIDCSMPKDYVVYAANFGATAGLQIEQGVVVGYSAEIKEVIIPKLFKGYAVTSVGNGAFSGCSGLTSITIPDSVTSIGDSAFRDCSGITSVTIPDSVTSIDREAFYGCSGLTSVTIPDSVTTIGTLAFRKCTALIGVTIGNGITTIGSNAFQDCYKLVEIINKSSLNLVKGSTGNGFIARYALNIKQGGCSDIVNRNGYLFYTYSETNYLLEYIGLDEELTLPNNYNGNSYEIYKDAFVGCTGLTSVTVPDSVTSIGDYAFKGCSGLTSITIPDSVTSIGSSAFYNCSGLTNVIIGNGVTSIREYAFV